jgi:FKBP-type peptidyl-prolyl cis-trans isomerase
MKTAAIVALLVVLAVVWMVRNVQRQKEAAAKALEEGKVFLLENAKKEGVITLPSGLQYEILKAAEGAKPTIKSKVTTHYHGTLINGTVFDSSVERGQPLSFPLNAVIRGWQEGIPLMSVGAKYRFFIPQDLAYGMQSPSPAIPGGSALIFEVELLSFE